MPQSGEPSHWPSARVAKFAAGGLGVVLAIAAGTTIGLDSREPPPDYISDGQFENIDTSYLGPRAASEDPWVYFIGDSYCIGTDQDGRISWTQRVARYKGYYGLKVCENGAGYTRGGDAGGTLLSLLEESALPDAQMIVLSGGLSDPSQNSEQQFRERVREVITLVVSLAPNVPVVILSPFAPNLQVAQQQSGLREAVKAEAETAKAIYIDVSNLFVDKPELIGVDGVHPTREGAQYITETILPLLPSPAPKKGA